MSVNDFTVTSNETFSAVQPAQNVRLSPLQKAHDRSITFHDREDFAFVWSTLLGESHHIFTGRLEA